MPTRRRPARSWRLPPRGEPDHLAAAGRQDAGGPKGIEMESILLKPVPIVRDNLNIVVDAGWVSKDVVCQGVDAAKSPAACK